MSCRSTHQPRGAALVLAIIVIMIVTVIGVAALRIGTREVSSAYSGAKRQAMVACAEAARQLLVSRLHALGTDPTQLGSLNLPIDGTATGTTRAVGGHIDEDPVNMTVPDPTKTQVQITQVIKLPPNAFGPTKSVGDITNVVQRTSGQGGTPYRVLAHCVDQGDGTPTGGRQLEVEFGVRFGL